MYLSTSRKLKHILRRALTPASLEISALMAPLTVRSLLRCLAHPQSTTLCCSGGFFVHLDCGLDILQSANSAHPLLLFVSLAKSLCCFYPSIQSSTLCLIADQASS